MLLSYAVFLRDAPACIVAVLSVIRGTRPPYGARGAAARCTWSAESTVIASSQRGNESGTVVDGEPLE